MQPTFLRRLIFAPLAPGAKILTQADGAGAERTADAGEKLVVQRVVGGLVQLYVMPHIAPGGEIAVGENNNSVPWRRSSSLRNSGLTRVFGSAMVLGLIQLSPYNMAVYLT